MNFPRQWEKFFRKYGTDTLAGSSIYHRQTHDPVKRNKQTHFPSCFYCLFVEMYFKQHQTMISFSPGEGNLCESSRHESTCAVGLEKCSWAILWIFREIKLKFKRKEFACVRALGARFFIDLQSRTEKSWRIQMIRIERKAIKFDLFPPRLRNIIQEN